MPAARHLLLTRRGGFRLPTSPPLLWSRAGWSSSEWLTARPSRGSTCPRSTLERRESYGGSPRAGRYTQRPPCPTESYTWPARTAASTPWTPQPERSSGGSKPWADRGPPRLSRTGPSSSPRRMAISTRWMRRPEKSAGDSSCLARGSLTQTRLDGGPGCLHRSMTAPSTQEAWTGISTP